MEVRYLWVKIKISNTRLGKQTPLIAFGENRCTLITDYRKPCMAAASDVSRAAQHVKADKISNSNVDFFGC